MTPRAFFVALPFVVVGLGCGEASSIPNLVPVSGNVIFDGQPLSVGIVTFNPVDPKVGQPATGQIRDGKFKMVTTASAQGVVAGEYKVRIESREELTDDQKPDTRKPYVPVIPASIIPEKYSDFSTSGLDVQIEAGMAPVEFNLEAE